MGAAIRSLFQTHHATFNSDLTLHSQNLETSGDLAYDSGDFLETLTTITTGGKIPSKGSYILARFVGGKANQATNRVFSSATPCLGIAHEQAESE